MSETDTKRTTSQRQWAIYAVVAIAVLAAAGYYLGWYGSEAMVATPVE